MYLIVSFQLQMQLIMYHNSSGREAFTKKLKSKEVHRAISLHPIKQHAYLYRLHNYMNVSAAPVALIISNYLLIILTIINNYNFDINYIN